MDKLQLSLACRELRRGMGTNRRTGPRRRRGADAVHLNLPVEETFYRMLRFQEFDAAEVSLS